MKCQCRTHDGEHGSAVPTPDQVFTDFSASYWLKAALKGALKRDPVDAANDADMLARVLDRECRVGSEVTP